MQKGCHLVYEGASAACTGLVHAQIYASAEIEDLGVLAAELYGNVGLGGYLCDNARGGNDLLDKGEPQDGCEVEGSRACDSSLDCEARVECVQLCQYVCQSLARGRAVALIFLKENLALGIGQDSLDRDGPKVDSQKVWGGHISLLHGGGSNCAPGELESKIVVRERMRQAGLEPGSLNWPIWLSGSVLCNPWQAFL